MRYPKILNIITIFLISFFTVIKVSGQQFQINGKVTDNDGNPLPGVNIYEKKSQRGTITDLNGNFSLDQMEKGEILVFSFIGFQKKEIEINDQTALNVTIIPDYTEMEEAVVVGYGTVKKSDLTSAIATVKDDAFKDIPLGNAFDALRGKASGVYVKSPSGEPGQTPIIRIRGSSSFRASNDPLIVVDGSPVEKDYFATINPQDIASVEVLKDASAAAIYGSRGANGVIMITTKRGIKGETQINFSTYHGWQSPTKNLNLLNSKQNAELINEINSNAGFSPPGIVDSLLRQGIENDWQDLLFQNAPMQNYNVSFRGGKEDILYMFSAGYLKQEGIVQPSLYDRYNFRLNLDNKVSDKLNLGVNLSGSYSHQSSLKNNENAFNGAVVASALATPPFLPIYNDDGTYAQNPLETNMDNPIATAFGLDDNGYNTTLLGTVFGKYQLWKKLFLNSSFSVQKTNFKRDTYLSMRDTYIGRVTKQGEARSMASQSISWLWENTLLYEYNFLDSHNLKLMAGYTQQMWTYEGNSAARTGFTNDNIKLLTAGANMTGASNRKSERSMISYIARLNYGYNGKYLITATMRADGSSRFGPKNKYGYFPSASAAWILSKESFFPILDPISLFKVRFAWGETGNDGIGDYNYLTTYGTGTIAMNAGETLYSSYSPNGLAYEELQWETTKQTNLGFDLSFYADRITLSADYYWKQTTNLLATFGIPMTAGYGNAGVTLNFGQLMNEGIETSFTSHNTTGALKWTTDFSFTSNRNEIVNIGDYDDPHISSDALGNALNVATKGKPIWSIYGHEMIGIFQTPDQVTEHAFQAQGTAPGDVIFKDQPDEEGNTDGQINANDRIIIGNPHPDYVIGLTNSFNYKGIDLMINANAVLGKDVYNATRSELDAMTWNRNATVVALDRWQGEGDDTNVPRAIKTDPNDNNRASTRFLENGSFLKIRDIVIGYTLPKKWMSVIKIEKMRVYFSLSNYFTFTEYSGYDPEIGDDKGVDYNPFPHAKTMVFGLNMDF